nr:hypothetical protein [Tanacetum cinerariifolium]
MSTGITFMESQTGLAFVAVGGTIGGSGRSGDSSNLDYDIDYDATDKKRGPVIFCLSRKIGVQSSIRNHKITMGVLRLPKGIALIYLVPKGSERAVDEIIEHAF